MKLLKQNNEMGKENRPISQYKKQNLLINVKKSIKHLIFQNNIDIITNVINTHIELVIKMCLK